MEAGDYYQWTKENLITKIKKLEKQLQEQQQLLLGHKGKPERTLPSNASSTSPPQPRADGQEEEAQDQAEEVKSKKRKKGVIDPSKYSTRYIALKLAYLGKNYNGFEYQPSGALPAVEAVLWKALVKACLIFPEKPDEVNFNICEYSKCGRTDRGVSAFGQVIALRVRSNRPVTGSKRRQQSLPASRDETRPETVQAGEQEGQEGQDYQEEEDEDETPYPVESEVNYIKVLNNILPPDIRILAWCPTPPPGFSARFSCRERQYRYYFTQPAFTPMPESLEFGPNGVAGRGNRPKDGWLDMAAMREAASYFVGPHDFRNFCKVDPTKQIVSYERHVFEADIVEVPDLEAASLPYLSGTEFAGGAHVEGGSSSTTALPKVYFFHVRGSAFLWHQIRHMVAVLFLVGQGLEPPTVVRDLLDPNKYPGRPYYNMASDAPLVLWDCLFGRVEGSAEPEWVYAGGWPDLHGPGGLIDEAWAGWRARKVDEILANRLLDRITTLTNPGRAVLPPGKAKWKGKGRSRGRGGQKVFEGGDGPHPIGTYMPLDKRPRMPSPEEVNDKWAKKKGFNSGEEMRGTENWRSVIKAAKNGNGDGVMRD